MTILPFSTSSSAPYEHAPDVSGQLQAAAGREIRVCFFSMMVSLYKKSAESVWPVHNLLLQIGLQSWCEGTFEDGRTAMGIMN
jgi:hypothetical protein